MSYNTMIIQLSVKTSCFLYQNQLETYMILLKHLFIRIVQKSTNKLQTQIWLFPIAVYWQYLISQYQYHPMRTLNLRLNHSYAECKIKLSFFYTIFLKCFTLIIPIHNKSYCSFLPANHTFYHLSNSVNWFTINHNLTIFPFHTSIKTKAPFVHNSSNMLQERLDATTSM